MRNASVALTNFLNSATEFYVADLLTLVQTNGTATYLTTAPGPITVTSQVDGLSHTFLPGGESFGRPMFKRDRTKLVVGLQVDSMGLTLMMSPTMTIGGIPWPDAARLGYLDAARIAVERLYMATWGDVSKGTLIIFSGRAGQITPSRSTVQIAVNADLVLLDLPLPHNTYGPMCSHNLFDAGCTLSRAAFTNTGTCAASCTTSTITASAPMAHTAAGYYELGVLTFTSGPNAGVARQVKLYNASVFTLAPPLPYTPTPAGGDAFEVTAGCDKVVALNGDVTLGTCKVKFNNLQHARAFPFVPTPENAR